MISKKYLHSFAEAFICRTDMYDMQRSNGSYFTVYQALTLCEIERHLFGEITIAGFTIDGKNMVRDIAFDEDKDLDGLNRIYQLITGWGLCPIFEGSRWTKPTADKPNTLYKPGHLRLILDKKIPSKIAYQFAHQVATMANARHLECNPKAPELKSGGKGTVLKLPLSINRKEDCYPNERAWFDGIEHDLLVQLKWVHEQLPVNNADLIMRLATELPPIIKAQPKYRRKDKTKYNLLLELVPDNFPLRQNPSGQFITGCPACVINGNDRSMSNLTINAEGNLMYCFYNAGAHNFQDILSAFQYLSQSAQPAS